MKKTLLATFIGVIFSTHSAIAQADERNSMLAEMSKKIETRLLKINKMAEDPKNWEIKDGKRYFRFNDYLYTMSEDNEPLFMPFVLGSSYEENVAYADRSAQAMFDFIKTPWHLTNEQNGVYVYHDQFGFNYVQSLEGKQCNVRYLADHGVISKNNDCLIYDEKTVNALGIIDELVVNNHLVGSFAAQIRFIQNQTSEPNGNADKSQQKLVTHREALLIVTPEKEDLLTNNVVLKIFKDNQLVDTRVLKNPLQLLKADRTIQDERPDIQFSKRSYSIVLPWEYIEKGLSLKFETYDGKIGELTEDVIEFGPPTHVNFPMVRIGMLTDPAAPKQLESQMATYGAELFQRFPFATMTISPYLPVKLDKIVTAYGEVETQYSEFDDPGTYSGDLRENITKSLIQTGINNANYGVTSTAGTHQWQPGHFPSVVIGHSIGRYKDKHGQVRDVAHGLSGGNGMVLLFDAINNEVTHEIGHALSLWDWPVGPDIYFHNISSGWGYDAFSGRMSDNVVWYNRGSDDRDFAGIVGFHKDPMAGGNFDSNSSSYPLFTNFTSKIMQEFITNFDILDMDSNSGYSNWNTDLQQMQPVTQTDKPKPAKNNVNVMTMVGYYDPQNENLGYIYPPMYGASGQVYDFADRKLGQCWATVRYPDNRVQDIPLEANRLDTNMSNKFHINLAREDNPSSMSINCPEHSLDGVVKQKFLTDINQDQFYNWGENNKAGEPGDVFHYLRGGRVEYFRLKTHGYGYFPPFGTSNFHWDLLGYLDDFVKEYIAEYNPSFADLGEMELASRSFTTQNEYPEKAVTFGRDHDGYVRAVEETKTFAEIPSISHQKFSSMAAFDNYVLSLRDYSRFGQNEQINDANAVTSQFIGALYSFNNPQTNTRDFYMMKHTKAIDFPTNQASNEDWKYIGSAESYVNLALNPILLDREGTDHQARIKAYYGLDELLTQTDINSTTKPYSVFVHRLTDGTQSYFMQKIAGAGGSLPTTAVSDQYWHFIASDSTLTEQLALWQDRDQFEIALLDWYSQDNIKNWGDNNQYGNIGDVYIYDFTDGKRHYYRLKEERYGFFPFPNLPVISNNQWEYLGAF